MADVRERTRNDAVAVGVTAVEIAPAVDRVALYVRNTSTGAQKITIVCSALKPVVNYGIVLSPGDVFCDSDSAEYKCWRGQVLAIGDLAGGQVSVFER
jgi:hypothetical protein